MMTSSRFASGLLFLILFVLSSGARAACGYLDPDCKAGEFIKKATEDARKASEKAVKDTGNVFEKPFGDSGKFIEYHVPNSGITIGDTGVVASDPAKPLQPVRAFLRAKDIPPVGAGAYGVIVFHSKPTSANRSKLKMVCNSFVAFFPRNENATAPLKDQMITVWPLDNPDAAEAKKDDCDYAMDHYDLIASEEAIRDAQRQHANFDGEGPYLVGWSPSKARGVADALVLVMDMSSDNSQAQIDQKFLFWKNKIVEDPSAWRDGFSIERFRVALRIFADQYGQSMLDAIKLIGDKKP
jgi:hypothetical protein